jgi:hypothetical protein
MRLSKITIVCAALFIGVGLITLLVLLHYRPGSVAGVTVQNYAAVPANPYNQAAEQLSRKEAELSAREAAVNAAAARQSRLTGYLYVVLGALFVLILINFYLDFKRSGPRQLFRRPVTR